MRLSSMSLRSASSVFPSHGVKRERSGRARDLRLPAFGAEEQVRVEAEHRIAPAHRAAFDRLEQEGVPPAPCELQEGRNRRLQIRDEARENELRLAFRVTRFEAPVRGLYLHRSDARPILSIAGITASASGR